MTRKTSTTDDTDPTHTTDDADPTHTAGRPRHVVLLGMMGAGKTRTGAALSVRLGWPLVDGDAVLEAQQGRTGAQIAATEGVDHLHRLEERVLLDALASDQPAVIAPAACVIEDERCVEAMRSSAMVAWLDLPADQLGERMLSGSHRRAMPSTDIQALLDRRGPRFAKVADVHLDAASATDELVATIMDRLSDQLMARLGDQPAERSDQGPASTDTPRSAT